MKQITPKIWTFLRPGLVNLQLFKIIHALLFPNQWNATRDILLNILKSWLDGLLLIWLVDFATKTLNGKCTLSSAKLSDHVAKLVFHDIITITWRKHLQNFPSQCQFARCFQISRHDTSLRISYLWRCSIMSPKLASLWFGSLMKGIMVNFVISGLCYRTLLTTSHATLICSFRSRSLLNIAKYV